MWASLRTQTQQKDHHHLKRLKIKWKGPLKRVLTNIYLSRQRPRGIWGARARPTYYTQCVTHMLSRMKSICSSWYYCSRSRVTQVEENRKSMIDDGHLLAPSDADLHLQPQLHRRHPLNIEHWFSRCLGRNFITSMCGYYASPSPSLLWISHSLILTVTVILLWFTFYPLSLFLSHLPLSLSLSFYPLFSSSFSPFSS